MKNSCSFYKKILKINKVLLYFLSLIVFTCCTHYQFVESDNEMLSEYEAKQQQKGYRENFKNYFYRNEEGNRMKGIIHQGQKYPIILVKNKNDGRFYIAMDNNNIISNLTVDCVNPNLKWIPKDSLSPMISDSLNITIKDEIYLFCFIGNRNPSYSNLNSVHFFLKDGWYWELDSSKKLVKKWFY